MLEDSDKKFIFTIAILVLLVVCYCRCRNTIMEKFELVPGHHRFHILLIVTDQERYFEKYPDNLNLNARTRLAKEGVVFRKHYTNASGSSPSRSVIYTGQHTQQNNIFDNINLPYVKDLCYNCMTVGHALRKRGYYTAYKGKWGLSEKPSPALIDEYGFADYQEAGEPETLAHGGFMYDPVVAKMSMEWLSNRGQKLHEENRPWFLAVNLTNPHDISYFNTDDEMVEQNTGNLLATIKGAPDSRLYKYKYDYPLPKTLLQSPHDAGRPHAHEEHMESLKEIVGEVPLKEDNWRRYQDYYFNCLKDSDMQIELILNHLDKLELREHTAIVFTSTHGEMGGAHGVRGTGPFSYEENVHVPFIISHPNGFKGRDTNTLTCHFDIAPTLESIAVNDFYAKTPDQYFAKASNSGKSIVGGRNNLSSLLFDTEVGRQDELRPAILYTYDGFVTLDNQIYKRSKIEKEIRGFEADLSKRGHVRTVITKRFKFSRYFAPTEYNMPHTYLELIKYNDVELFDMGRDPEEKHNLALQPARHMALILRMNQFLNMMINHEIGEDVGQNIPLHEYQNWIIDKVDL